MKRTLLGTALALTLFATPALAQQQPGTGGGAGGESGSAAQTDKNKGAPPTNPSAAPAGQMGTTGSATTGTSTGGGTSSATGTGGGKGGESGSAGATDKTPNQRGNPATPTR